jgi:hypothetical protein
MEAVRTSETSVDNQFTRQYNPEDSSEQCNILFAICFATVLLSEEVSDDHLRNGASGFLAIRN